MSRCAQANSLISMLGLWSYLRVAPLLFLKESNGLWNSQKDVNKSPGLFVTFVSFW